MRIGFYNPYFDTLGGGERYMLSIAAHLSKTHTVELLWDDSLIIQKASQRFSMDLVKINLKKNFFAHDTLALKLVKSHQYDLIFFFTDGSIPVSLSRKNILMFEVPFQNMHIPDWKLNLYTKVVSISEFTMRNLPNKVQQRSIIIYPPVDVDAFSSGNKSKIILSVGRFGTYPSKKHIILIEAFRELTKKMRGWKFIIAGGLHPSDQAYFDELYGRIKNLPIELIPNIQFKALQKLYSESPIYWHAAGYGESNPENMEHFGITPVEAMAAGSVPIAFRGGGLPEIIDHGKNGLLWDSPEQLIRYTTTVLSDTVYLKKLNENAILKSRKFNPKNFYNAIDDLMDSLERK